MALKLASYQRLSEPELVQWLISLDLALVQLLLILTISLLVLVKNSKSVSFSKLTFQPYYSLFGY